MSDTQPELSDAEKMRLKRLARLGGPPTAAPSAPAPAADHPTEPHQPQPGPSASSRLLNSTPVQSTSTPKQAPKASTSTPPVTRPIKRPSPTSVRAEPAAAPAIRKPAPPARLPVPYPEWEAQRIQGIFSVTLSRGDAQRSDWTLCWLKELHEEIESEGGTDSKISAELADRLLIARLSLDPKTLSTSSDPDMLNVLAGMPQNETTFEYLAGCWKRLNIAVRDTNRHALDPADKESWTAAVDKCRGLIISYIGMTLEDPSMFPQPDGKPLGPAEFLPLLLSLTPESSTQNILATTSQAPLQKPAGCLSSTDLLPFLHDLAAGFSDDTLADVLTPTLSLFFQQWFSITPAPDLLGNEWQRYMGAISTLVQVKDIAAALPTLAVWLSTSADASRVEWQSLLGPLVRQSVYPREFAEIWRTYFSDPTERNVKDIDANKDNLRQTLGALQTSLFNIFNSIVRASPASREQILDYFAHIVRLNKKRAGMRVDHRTVSSDGFMTNLQVILLKLFEPVMDTSFSKIDKIDPRYFQNSSRVDIEDETKVKATKEEADAYFGADKMDVDKVAPNFISDLFFLLNAYQHFGLVKTIGNRSTAERNLSDIEKELKRAEASRGDWQGNPAMEAQGEAQLKKLKGDLSTLHASLHAYDTQLLDPGLVRPNLTYVGYLMTWLVRQVDPKHAFPQTQISLPLPEESPQDFRMLPEYLFENVADYIEFLSRYNADALDDADKDILITFTIVFLSPGYVNNPFMKAKLVSGLSNGVIPQGYWRKGPLFERLSVHPLSTQYLMPTLIRFFIDVEMTGGHTQFWDKFNFRRDISRIIKAMWSNPLHRQAFIQTRHDNFDQFIRFTNMLMSDTTFHLEESLTGLAKINSIEGQKANVEAWNALPQPEREDLVQTLRQTENSTPFHTIMGLDHIELMRDLTATTREPFVTGEIVDRLAATLDENLATLVGPKMSELKVADPDRFKFKPKKLLAALAQVYLNLAPEGDFIRAVANDGRSYSKQLFERFARTLKNRAIMTDAEVAGVVAFAQKVEDMKATIMIEDEREIPDEFLDPLMSTLMKDPVILPMSRVVIDRATIRTALLSKEVDPFNNVPLKYEELIADTDLKAKIDAWVAEGKAGPADNVMEVEQL